MFGRIISATRAAAGLDLPAEERGRRLVSLALFTLGTILLTYVLASYLSMYREQRSLMQQWEAQNLELAPAAVLVGSPSRGDHLSRLSIPKIKLDVVIMEGTSNHTLALGPGHLNNTAYPGEPGNAVIAAHRDTYFRKLYELKNGDDIYVQRDRRTYHYIVTAKRVVLPTDLSVLDSTGESRLTLITCYPVHFIGPAPERLIVSAKLIKEI